MHRNGDLPALVASNGAKQYWKNGVRHRDRDSSGILKPAVISEGGHLEYWENGREILPLIP